MAKNIFEALRAAATTSIGLKELPVVDVPESVKQNLELLPTQLTDIEFRVLLGLLKAQVPVTARLARVFSMVASLPEEELNLTTESKIGNFEKNLQEQFRSYLSISPPAYESVSSALKNLESVGIVIRRVNTGKSPVELWAINPIFYKLWFERRKEIVSELSKKPAKMRKIAYPERQLIFFDIHLPDEDSANQAYSWDLARTVGDILQTVYDRNPNQFIHQNDLKERLKMGFNINTSASSLAGLLKIISYCGWVEYSMQGTYFGAKWHLKIPPAQWKKEDFEKKRKEVASGRGSPFMLSSDGNDHIPY